MTYGDFRFLLPLIAVTMHGVTAARADIVLKYSFAGSPGNQLSETADSVFSGATASTLARGAGVNPHARADSIDSTDWQAASASAANTAGDYYAFTFTPSSGHAFTLTSIDFAEIAVAAGSGNGNRAPTGWAVRSSLDSFAANLASGTPATGTAANHTVTLGVAFQNLVSAVTFRLYAFDAGKEASEWALVDGTAGGLVVNGTATAVPEASSFWLGGLICGVVGLARCGHALLRRKQ